MNPTSLTLKPGEFLFREGEATNGVYLVREGQIEIIRESEGVVVILSTMGPGDVIGTLTIFSKESRTASARAHTAAQLIHVNREMIEGSFKNLPVWVQAVLKDSVARLKTSNDQLVEAKINERKLQLRIGTTFHSASQFAAFLAYGVRVGLIKDEGVELFPLKGFIERSEGVLLRRYEFFEAMLDCFVKGSLIKIQEDKKWGRSIMAPQAPLLEDFANFVLVSYKAEFSGFVPMKYTNLLSALVRLARKPDAKEFYTKADICELLQKEAAKTINDGIFDELVKSRVLLSTSGADKYSWNDRQVQKRIIFESTCRFLKDIKEDSASTRAA